MSTVLEIDPDVSRRPADPEAAYGPGTAAGSSALPVRTSLRVTTAAALTGVGALGAARIFERWAPALLALLVVPPVVVAIVVRRSAVVRWALHAVSGFVAVAIATALAGGPVPGRMGRGLWRGWADITSTDWPSPVRSELVAFLGVNVVAAAIATVELARTRRWRAMPLVPALLLGVLVTALAAPAGPPPPGAIVAWLVLAGCVLALGDGARTPARLGEAVRGELRTVAILAVFAVVAGIAATRIGGSGASAWQRSDPRGRTSNPPVESVQLNPLAAVAAERTGPVQPRFSYTGAAPDGGRWRLQVLDRYDGVAWRTALTVRPVSRSRISDPRSGPVTGETFTAATGSFVWLPVAGTPVSADRDVSSDVDRSVLALDHPLAAEERVTVSARPGPSRADVPADASSGPARDPEAAPLTSTAVALGGPAASLPERLDAVARGLREGYTLDDTAASGTNIGLLQRMLQTTRAGSPEQFVAAFVVLAHALGATARIAIGYHAPTDGSTVTTADATAWPEVFFAGVGWVAFDPVPSAHGSGATQGAAPAGGGRASSPPDTLPVPPPAAVPHPTTKAASGARRSGVPVAFVLGGGGVGVLLALFGLMAASVALWKRRRRRRRLRADEPHDQVLGAWAEATDGLVDLGARLEAHLTNAEMVVAAEPVLPAKGAAPLGELAALANEAAHGGRPLDGILAAHAIRLLAQVEEAAAEPMSRWRRRRWRWSTRSLRRATRSPVS